MINFSFYVISFEKTHRIWIALLCYILSSTLRKNLFCFYNSFIVCLYNTYILLNTPINVRQKLCSFSIHYHSNRLYCYQVILHWDKCFLRWSYIFCIWVFSLSQGLPYVCIHFQLFIFAKNTFVYLSLPSGTCRIAH